jgi:hypothetical protein
MIVALLDRQWLRRGLLAVLAIVAVSLLAGSYFNAYLEWRAAQAAVARTERLAMAQAVQRAGFAGLAGDSGGAPAILPAGSIAEAQASLQNYVRTVLSAAGARVSRMELLPVQDRPDFRHIGLRVSLNVDPSGLRTALYALEYGKPIIAVHGLRVRAADGRAVAPDPRQSIDLEITALQHGEAT